jgi:hypothetical protein|eukprot:COSAG01_NODE_4153_length_5292_cov_11.627768_6_plen_156_part_00
MTVHGRLRTTREAVWSWLVEYPLQNGNWCALCEDITVAANQWITFGATDPEGGGSTNKCDFDNYNSNQKCTKTCNYDSIQSLTFVRYALLRRIPGWQTHVPKIIDFVERKLIFFEQPGPAGHGPPIQWGARTVAEQRADRCAAASCFLLHPLDWK